MPRGTKSSRLVLIVDDEPVVRHIASLVLRREGIETIEAADGIEGLSAVRERGDEVAIVLTDVRMPRSDGFSLAQLVRQLYPNMPIVFMSGFPGSEDGRQVGESEFLEKPFHPETLIETVRRLLDDSRTGER